MENGVLVTGGAGFIGSHVVNKLRQKGLDVIVADNLSRGKEQYVPEGVPLERIDVTDAESVKGLFNRYNGEISYVVHLAAYINLQESMRNPIIDAQNNVIGTLNVLKEARDHGIKKLVFSSSAAVYGDIRNPDAPVTEATERVPTSPYGNSKLHAETSVRMLSGDMGYTVFRFGNIIGERQILASGEGGVIPVFLDRLSRNKGVELRDYGKATRDYIYAGDIADAVLLGFTAPDGTYNLGTKTGTDVSTVWSTLCKYFSQDGSAIPDAKLVPLMAGEIPKMILSGDKARDAMGWEPKVQFEESIKRTVEWYKNRDQKVAFAAK
jgi:UDP-glucose 4-epimerase